MSRSFFADVRRAGFGADVSGGKLTEAMLEILLRLTEDAPLSKEGVVRHLGLVGQLSKTRDLSAAWDVAKRRAARDHSENFRLEGSVLERETADDPPPLGKLSSAGHRRLATLAAKEGLDPDQFLGELIKARRAARK